MASTRPTPVGIPMPKRTCPRCKRHIRLIKHNGTFRRHTISKGKVCSGSWTRPS